MKRIPFNIKYKDDIILKKMKVVTKDNRTVDILKWDCQHEKFPIVGTIISSNKEEPYSWTIDGKTNPNEDFPSDLFILMYEETENLNKFKKGHWYLCTRTHTLFEKGTSYESLRDGTISDGCGRSYLTEKTYNINYFIPCPKLTEFENLLKTIINSFCQRKGEPAGIEYMTEDGARNIGPRLISLIIKDIENGLYKNIWHKMTEKPKKSDYIILWYENLKAADFLFYYSNEDEVELINRELFKEDLPPEKWDDFVKRNGPYCIRYKIIWKKLLK